MKAWQFSTEAFPPAERVSAWREALGRLNIPVGRLPDDGTDFEGRISVQTSPLGMKFSLIEAESMELSGENSNQKEAIWLGITLKGDAQLIQDGRECAVVPGDIVYAPTGVPVTLNFPGRFRQMFVNAPKLALNPRVLVPMSLSLGRLSGQEGIAKVFSGLLMSLGDVLTEVKSHQLRPVELAITEFLMTSLDTEKRAFGLGGAESMKASHLHRICQDIETRLTEPELNLTMVAEMSGVSTRYLQKLFNQHGKSFSSYVRKRRLERCRADLASPLHSSLSISEICFRWGFNGSAHFSRIFRAEYGETPRDYRRRVGASIEDRETDPSEQRARSLSNLANPVDALN